MSPDHDERQLGTEDGSSITLDWFVNPQTLADFYEKFKGEKTEVIQKRSYEEGLALGRKLLEQLGIEGNDEHAIAALLREVLQFEPTAKILSEGEGKLLLRNAGFCPVMAACLSLNLPWGWMCEVLGWPFFHGLASAVNPKVDLRMVRRRMKGDPYCDHLFEMGEGKLITD
jgi:hypothetical protein